MAGVTGAATGAVSGAAAGPIGAAIGGLIGFLAGSGGDKPDMSAAINAINGLQIPDIDKALLIQQYQQSGTLTPELVQQLPLNADTKTQLTEAPENRQNQQTTLDALKRLSQSGVSAQDLAQMQQMRSETAQDANAKIKALQQQAQMRGQGGAGDALAASLSQIQGGAQTASKDALNQAANAAAARQSALTSFGNMSGQVRGQDYATQQANQQNELARQRFLDTNSISRQNANVQAKNAANEMNLQRQQQTADRNVQAQNTELDRQAKAKQQMYEDQALKANLLTKAYGAKAGADATQNAASAQNWTNIGTGLGGVAGSFFNKSAPTAVKDMTYSDAMSADDQRRKDNSEGIGMSHGGMIPGIPEVPGDSPKNDTVNIKGSPGELVVPVSKMKNPVDAKAFVDKHFNGKSNKLEPMDKNHAILDLIATLHAKKLRGNTGLS